MVENLFEILNKLDNQTIELMKDSKYYLGDKGMSFFCDESYKKHQGSIMVISSEKNKVMVEVNKLSKDLQKTFFEDYKKYRHAKRN